GRLAGRVAVGQTQGVAEGGHAGTASRPGEM
ncbi:uncharacterized protein METZ01_LOCUS432173, partial [marine metagenome]